MANNCLKFDAPASTTKEDKEGTKKAPTASGLQSVHCSDLALTVLIQEKKKAHSKKNSHKAFLIWNCF